MQETKTLATWVATLRHDDIPENVREHARRFILDNLGCQIGGAPLPWSRTYYDVIRKTRTGSHSTVAYFGDRQSPDDAAFVNSAFNHANEADDTFMKCPTHAGNIAVPAALAMAEYAKGSGEQLLVAVVAAYEIQFRIALACAPFLLNRGHHPPPGVGPFGAAAASAAVMKLDAEKTLNALAIAGSYSSGLMEFTRTGGSAKRIHSAIAAQGGVRAALFAESGITGPHSILEGEKGFCKVFAGEYDAGKLTDGLGAQYHMLDNAVKLHSCCHHIHTALDALDKVREYAPLKPEQVKSITVYMNSRHILSNIGSIVEPQDVLGAQFSLQFSLAMRLHHGGRGVNGGNGFWDYPNIDLKDPRLLETARKVKCEVANTSETRLDKGAGMDIETTDGRHIREIVAFSKGLPENPLSAAEIEEKFYSLVNPVLPAGRPAEIVHAVNNLKDVKTIDELARLLVA